MPRPDQVPQTIRRELLSYHYETGSIEYYAWQTTSLGRSNNRFRQPCKKSHIFLENNLSFYQPHTYQAVSDDALAETISNTVISDIDY